MTTLQIEPKVGQLLAEPRTVKATGLTVGFLSDLAIKTLYYESVLSGFDLCERLKLPFHSTLEELLELMRREKLVEVRGSANGSIISGSFQYLRRT